MCDLLPLLDVHVNKDGLNRPVYRYSVPCKILCKPSSLPLALEVIPYILRLAVHSTLQPLQNSFVDIALYFVVVGFSKQFSERFLKK